MTSGRGPIRIGIQRALLFCAATLVTPAPGFARQAAAGAPHRPNVLLLMADQHRGDALGCNGNAAIRTPNLDRLAREGCTFTRAYSSTPSCTPARAALLTGMSPWGHGMLGYYRVAEQYPIELPRILEGAGYRSHVVGKNHFAPQRHAHGYDEVELDESGRHVGAGFVSDYRQWFAQAAPGLDPDALGIGWNDYRAGAYPHPESLHPTTWTGDRAVRFIEEYAREEPFFLKVSFARPHSPYDPPARLVETYEGADIPAPFLGEWSRAANGERVKPDAHTAARNNLGAELTRRSRLHYYASVTFVDEQIGRILDALEARGMLADTVILYTSDHGDMLGDHHLWRKTYAYEGSARIPMVLWWGANVADAPRGQTRSEPVELRDVLPTFLDAAGVPRPESVEGRSLLALVRGGGEPWREVLDLEHATIYWPENAWTALTDGHTKYVYFARDGAQQLFDLDADPGETVDLARDPAHAERLASWRRRMVEHLAPRGAPWVVEGELGIREKPIVIGPNYPRASHAPGEPFGQGELDVLPDGGEGLLHAWLLAQAREQFDLRRAGLADALASAAATSAHLRSLRAGYRLLLGELPERTPLEPVVTGVLARDGYRIEKVHYASRPHHRVTANLYVPTTGAGPFPGVLVACGHSADGKAYGAYQSVCALLALNGFVALIYDPIGQGERHQLDGPGHGTTAHEMLAYGALLVGDSIVKHEAWDGIRSLDYLLSRPEVDAALPIGMTGNSGGGTQTTFLAALDDRIAVAAPSCYVMTRERLFATNGPQDACQHLYGEGALGIEHADYLALRAPKPTLLLAAERDFFEFDATRTAFGEARAIYERLGVSESVALFAVDDAHGFSRPRREAAVQWMRRWILDDPTPVVEPELVLATADELQVTATGQVRTSFEDERTRGDISLARARELATSRAAFWDEHSRDECLAAVRRLIVLAPVRSPVRARSFGAIRRAGFTVVKLGLERAGAPIVPALFFQPDEPAADQPVVLFVDGRGKSAEAASDGAILELVGAGRFVLSIDARGFGETADRGSEAKFHNVDQRVAAIALHIGRPLLGQRVDDVLAAIDHLTGRPRPASPSVDLIAIGAAGPVGMHAAALDPRVRTLAIRDSIRSWVDDVVARPAAPDLAGHVVPSALQTYDLPDLQRVIDER